MLKFVRSDIFSDTQTTYPSKHAFRLLCERVGVYDKETSMYNLKKSEILSTIFKSRESMVEGETWARLLMTKIDLV